MHIYARGMYTKGTFEIMLPYAGIIRIRFMGMISARISPDTPASISRPALPATISFQSDGPHKVSASSFL